MQSGRRKGASIICIIGGNKIDEKTFAYAWGLYFCSVFVYCICVLYLWSAKEKNCIRESYEGSQAETTVWFFVSTPGNVLEQQMISDNF